MAIRYDAFISYRHADVDSQAAADIQKRLERYRIPSAIRKKTGKQKIEWVFRDKEELPTTSDLNEDIGNALRYSEYLIVICSPRLKESAWCLKEIETFLQYHDRSHVLTVLAEGESYDVIPDIILQEEVVQPDGSVSVRQFEPLSCDYRLKKSRRVREEFPRLAAMIIGCSYNDLVQRQKQYRQKRMTAIFAGAFAIAAGFLIYAVQSNLKISENYNQSLVNQSLYLTEISGTLLKEGNREAAIKTALAALPDEENDRPLVQEPLYALNNALYSYQFATENTLDAVKNLESQSVPSDVIVYNEETASYAMIDSGGCGYLMDGDSMDLAFEGKASDLNADDQADFREVLTYKDGFLFFDESAFSYISSKGELVYSTTYGEDNDPDYMAYCVNGDTVVIANTTEIMIFHAEDGSLREKTEIPTDSLTFVPGICFSPSGNQFACYAVGTLSGGGFLCTYDLDQKKLTTIKESAGIATACYTDENTLALIEEDCIIHDILDYARYSTRNVQGLDLNTGKILWESEEGFIQDSDGEEILSLYQWVDTGDTSLCLAAGNELKLFDPKTGEEQFEMYYESQMVHMKEQENGTVLLVLDNGSICQQFMDESKSQYDRGSISTDIICAEDSGDFSVIMGCEDDRRYVKMDVVLDESVKVIEDDLAVGESGWAAVTAQDSDTFNCVYGTYDVGNGDYRGIRAWNADTLEQVFDYASDREGYEIQGLSTESKDGELYLQAMEQTYSSDGEFITYYHLFNLSAGQEITKEGGVPLEGCYGGLWMKNSDCICAWVSMNDLNVYDLEGNLIREIDVEEEEEESWEYKYINDEQISPDGKFLCLFGTDGENGITRVLNTETMEWVEFETYGRDLPNRYEGQRAALAKEGDELLTYTKDGRFLIFDLESGKVEQEIPVNGATIDTFDWLDHDSKVIFLGDDNYLKLWDLQSSSLIMQEDEQTEAYEIDGSSESEFFIARTGGITNMEAALDYIYQVDEDGSFHKYAAVEGGDLDPFDQVIMIKTANGQLAVSHIYSLEELQEKAKTVIGDEKLTEEEKNRYFMN